MTSLTRADVENRLYKLFDDIDWWRHGDLASAFTEDGVFSVYSSRLDRENGNASQKAEGREQLREFFRAAFANIAQTHHMISNVSVRIDQDRAVADIHMRAYHQGKGAVAHLFEESLSAATVTMRKIDATVLIEDFDYTMLLILGTTDVFKPL